MWICTVGISTGLGILKANKFISIQLLCHENLSKTFELHLNYMQTMAQTIPFVVICLLVNETRNSIELNYFVLIICNNDYHILCKNTVNISDKNQKFMLWHVHFIFMHSIWQRMNERDTDTQTHRIHIQNTSRERERSSRGEIMRNKLTEVFHKIH